MLDRIRTIYSHGLNTGLSSKSHVDSWVQQETPEEGWRIDQPKHNKDEDNRLNTPNNTKIIKLHFKNSDKRWINHNSSPQKLITVLIFMEKNKL